MIRLHRHLHARTALLAACLAACLLVGFIPVGSAAEAKSSAERFKDLVKEHQAAADQAEKLRRAAKTEEERQKASDAFPNDETYAARFMAIAEEDPKSPAAADCLAWIVVHDSYGPQSHRAVDFLLEHHVNSAKLAPVANALENSPTPHAERLLRAVVAQNPDAGVVNQTTYSLAVLLKETQSDSPKAQTEAEQLFERLAKGNSHLADQAQGQLFEIRNLAIGRTAPEIEGKDVDGKTFKLSEFRGRVVVLDFWGDW